MAMGFLAADTEHLRKAAARDLIFPYMPIASQSPILAVAAGNPKGIHTLEDLLRQDVRFALAHPESASIGALTKTALEAIGLWSRIQAAATVMKPSVTDLTTDLRTGAVDAVIIWDNSLALLKRSGFLAASVPVPALVITAAKSASASCKKRRMKPECGTLLTGYAIQTMADAFGSGTVFAWKRICPCKQDRESQTVKAKGEPNREPGGK